MPSFARYVGIDYSGAKTPTSSLKGLRIYRATRDTMPAEVFPPPGPRKYWTRRGVADWLLATLLEDCPTVVGIDHNLSLPEAYFEAHGIPPRWDDFLADFHAHWPTDGDHVSVESVRRGLIGEGAARGGNARWRRLAEIRTRRAKSPFHFDVQGSVAKSTHAGLPWIRFLRERLGGRVHFWPFDGWQPPPGLSVVAEVYPAMWKDRHAHADAGDDEHQRDARAVAAFLREADASGSLGPLWHPALSARERAVAAVEGWILGVG
jgi:hypothetical protein